MYNSSEHRRWKLRPFQGIIHDLKDRLPLYLSDWTDAYNYRVVPSTLLTFVTNVLPALAFAQDMFDRTDNAYGVNEVLMSSGIAGVVFGVFGGQPLNIVGVSGPISIFNYTVYDIVKPLDVEFFPFMFWVGIWAMVCHFLMAALNLVGLLRYVTGFPCDIFGMFINIVYLIKGVQILTRQFRPDDNGASGFASCVLAISMGIVGVAGGLFNERRYFKHWVRQFIVDYSMPACVVFFTGMVHFGGYFHNVSFERLAVTRAFHPTARDSWIDVTGTSVQHVFLALPFGIILTILFYFDHSVSSLMAQDSKYKLKKPAAFHYDFLLLGVTTGVSSMLGVPCPNGLIPQAPLHTESLLVKNKDGEVLGAVEQRLTNTLQGLMMFGMMTGPLLVCLGLIPQYVLAGLFFIMGSTGLNGNTIVNRIRYLLTEKTRTTGDDREKRENGLLESVPTRKVVMFVALSLVGVAAEVTLVNTKGAIGFPLMLLVTVLVTLWFPRVFGEHLPMLDGPVGHENTLKNL
jgi:TRAP-type C4-dicarboxylate transport system permease small subunit